MMRTHGSWTSAVAGAAILVLALGCSQPQIKDPGDAVMDKWKAKAQESKGFSPGTSSPAPKEIV